jgi:hypothetical protein
MTHIFQEPMGCICNVHVTIFCNSEIVTVCHGLYTLCVLSKEVTEYDQS